MGRFATNVAICLDNQEAAFRLRSGQPTLTSFNQIKEFQTLCNTWKSRNRATGVQVGTVLVRWIPGHQGILGNERADTLAKQACDQQTTRTLTSIARAKKYAQIVYNNASLYFWNRSAPERYKILGIQMTTRIPSELHMLTRKILGKLLAARSGHGDFADYHRRFKHENAVMNCECGSEKTPEHPFYCRKMRRSTRKPRCPEGGNIQENIKWALSSVQGARAFQKWCLDEKPYG